jgi:hypothetical protein
MRFFITIEESWWNNSVLIGEHQRILWIDCSARP